MTIPYSVGIAGSLLRSSRRRIFLIPLLAFSIIILAALMLTGSRGAEVGLLCGAAGWLAVVGKQANGTGLAKKASAGALILLLLVCLPLGWAVWADALPASIAERLVIAKNSLWLIEDFAFTGGGLGLSRRSIRSIFW